MAADIPGKAPIIPPPPVLLYNWTGFYLGGNVGYGWGRNSDPDVSFVDGSGIGLAAYFAAGGNVLPNVQPKGVIGGGQIGYNWMLAPSVVVGLVADFQGSGMKASETATVDPAGPSVLTNQSNDVKIDWFGTVRGKLGYAMNNWLLYATGGLAYGHIETSGAFNGPSVGLSYAGSNDTTRAGWTVGGGLDYGITRNWIIGAEYLYMDLGDTSYTMTSTNGVATATTLTVTNHVAAHIARVTLNYKF
jgi:outer membrane immunogenic protein